MPPQQRETYVVSVFRLLQIEEKGTEVAASMDGQDLSTHTRSTSMIEGPPSRAVIEASKA